MMRTVEALIERDGTIRLLEAIEVGASRRALVTILDEEPAPNVHEAALLSEAALSDWNRPEEEAAWAYLQREQ